MARQFKITAAKRTRERALSEKRQNKFAKRTEAKQEQPAPASGAAGAVDPDIAGIVPGPQPPQWWQNDE
jgi:hypothetical protein